MQRFCRPAARAPRSHAPRRGISLVAILVSIVIVLLATAATLSTLVARRAIAERDRATEDFEKAFGTIDEIVRAAAASNDLKGFKMMATRESLLNPALNYYQAYAQAHLNDDPPIPAVVDAQLHAAGLQAKLGSMKSTDSITQSMQYYGKLNKAKVDPETYPSMIGTTMKIAQPSDWMVLKGRRLRRSAEAWIQAADGDQHGGRDFPRYLQGFSSSDPPSRGPGGPAGGLGHAARAVPPRQGSTRPGHSSDCGHGDPGPRSAGRGGIQEPVGPDLGQRRATAENTKDIPAAKASYQKAIEIREQQIAASPDDKALASELETAKTELAKLPAVEQAAAPAEPAAEGAPADAAPAEAAAAPAEEPAADSAAATP